MKNFNQGKYLNDLKELKNLNLLQYIQKRQSDL